MKKTMTARRPAMKSNVIYIIVAASVTFLVRVLPLTLIRKPIKNRFIRSFLFYVPYITLAVMTFPAIVEAVSVPWAGFAALLAGIALAWQGAGLFPVAICSCVMVLIVEYLSKFIL